MVLKALTGPPPLTSSFFHLRVKVGLLLSPCLLRVKVSLLSPYLLRVRVGLLWPCLLRVRVSFLHSPCPASAGSVPLQVSCTTTPRRTTAPSIWPECATCSPPSPSSWSRWPGAGRIRRRPGWRRHPSSQAAAMCPTTGSSRREGTSPRASLCGRIAQSSHGTRSSGQEPRWHVQTLQAQSNGCQVAFFARLSWDVKLPVGLELRLDFSIRQKNQS